MNREKLYVATAKLIPETNKTKVSDVLTPIGILIFYGFMLFWVGAILCPSWISGTRESEHKKGIYDGMSAMKEVRKMGITIDTDIDSLTIVLVEKAYNYYWSENKEQK